MRLYVRKRFDEFGGSSIEKLRGISEMKNLSHALRGQMFHLCVSVFVSTRVLLMFPLWLLVSV